LPCRCLCVSRLNSLKAVFVCNRIKVAVPCNTSFAVRRQQLKSLHSSAFLWVRQNASQEEHGGKKEEEQKATESEPLKNNAEPPKMDPKRRRFLMVTMFLLPLSSVLLLLFVPFARKPMDFSDSDVVDADAFLTKFLAAGEVQYIIFNTEKRKAVAFLQNGAMIDGRPYGKPVAVVDCAKWNVQSADEFRQKIRQFEQQLGISEQSGVPLHVIHGMSTRRLVELTIGLLLIAVVMGQFGRVYAARFVQEQAKKAKGVKQ
jgi:hypothetical protein